MLLYCLIYKSRATSIQSYNKMLTKCIQELFAEEEHEFYVADGRGLRGAEVCSGDKFAVDLESSGERTRECKWTLEKYIKLSRMKYHSKSV